MSISPPRVRMQAHTPLFFFFSCPCHLWLPFLVVFSPRSDTRAWLSTLRARLSFLDVLPGGAIHHLAAVASHCDYFVTCGPWGETQLCFSPNPPALCYGKVEIPKVYGCLALLHGPAAFRRGFGKPKGGVRAGGGRQGCIPELLWAMWLRAEHCSLCCCPQGASWP